MYFLFTSSIEYVNETAVFFGKFSALFTLIVSLLILIGFIRDLLHKPNVPDDAPALSALYEKVLQSLYATLSNGNTGSQNQIKPNPTTRDAGMNTVSKTPAELQIPFRNDPIIFQKHTNQWIERDFFKSDDMERNHEGGSLIGSLIGSDHKFNSAGPMHSSLILPASTGSVGSGDEYCNNGMTSVSFWDGEDMQYDDYEFGSEDGSFSSEFLT